MKKIKNFGFQYIGMYLVTLDGCRVIYAYRQKSLALRRFRWASKSDSYVELWYQSSDGDCYLLDFFN